MSSVIVPVILAAGNSTRMGFPKALLPFAGGTFLTHILDILSGLQLPNPFVVLGKDAGKIAPTFAHRKVEVLINHAPERGQLSSIQLAVAELPGSCGGCMIWPVDHPAVSAELAGNLIRLFCNSDAALVMPASGQKRGHPVILRRDLFDEVLAQDPERGLKELVRRYQDRTLLLPMDESAAIADVDTPDEYFRLTGVRLDNALARRGPKESDPK
jgi:molybdenum cofactor cytidylyltransferase